jgi:hypothetical protein
VLLPAAARRGSETGGFDGNGTATYLPLLRRRTGGAKVGHEKTRFAFAVHVLRGKPVAVVAFFFFVSSFCYQRSSLSSLTLLSFAAWYQKKKKKKGREAPSSLMNISH